VRLGLFGGTFDPPHRGHVAVAAAARDELGLDRVEVVPCALPPHRAPAAASGYDRYAMTVLAFLDEERIVVSPRELLRGGVSYTIDTLDELAREQPEAELFLVIGGDSYDELPGWRAADEIVRRAHLAVVGRPGSGGVDRLRDEDRDRLRRPGSPPPREERAVYAVPMAPLPLAARAIRRAIAAGATTIEGLDPRVMRHIARRRLYLAPRTDDGTPPGTRERT